MRGYATIGTIPAELKAHLKAHIAIQMEIEERDRHPTPSNKHQPGRLLGEAEILSPGGRNLLRVTIVCRKKHARFAAYGTARREPYPGSTRPRRGRGALNPNDRSSHHDNLEQKSKLLGNIASLAPVGQAGHKQIVLGGVAACSAAFSGSSSLFSSRFRAFLPSWLRRRQAPHLLVLPLLPALRNLR